MTGRGSALAVPRHEGEAAAAGPGLAVDTADAAPASMRRFRCLNPFHFEQGRNIPVPGTDRFACSVESVWQGLKLVDGVTDPDMLRLPARKRPPESLRTGDYDYSASLFCFGGRTVDLVTARYLIYLPTYLHLLDRLVPDAVVGEVHDALDRGRSVYFYDWDANFDIEDDRDSFSHSAVLAAWFGGSLERELRRRAHWLGRHGIRDGPPLDVDRYRRLHSR
ncbi:hypothetical protein AB0A74_00580 [Saccharothrix sp. NPDC042600]|uniref:DUF6939 family protein n=1 Tax=Saccharothrix TaxID=2071 RepID=UPI00340ED10F|nr:hypothetical protein GCM10017745_48000 [Saccharothrix mutabilis subsp. capreolus]